MAEIPALRTAGENPASIIYIPIIAIVSIFDVFLPALTLFTKNSIIVTRYAICDPDIASR